MRELFIYYRSQSAHAATVQSRVHEFQAALCRAHPGLVARLLRRPEERHGLLTWMETYAIEPMAPSCRLDDDLQQQIERHAACLKGLLDGERHTEVFLPCAC
ncbi:DUF4936 family protein [Piscinibacter aquaticus]|uniref:DUF4936 family protein n=1 Tax=Piscinibacter aquaticus TaxID=392597 RepID=A0A5C6TZE9_9BURK|nr:DUF4936 family protein [Piscinibacter aquaticus]